MKKTFWLLLTIATSVVSPLPVSKTSPNKKGKSLNYFDDYEIEPSDLEYQSYVQQPPNEDYDENELGRTLPTFPRKSPAPPLSPPKEFNSPIYYIRLPPQPYMFVPGMGYVSHQPQMHSAASQFLNLPVDFISNGKPGMIYQWHGGHAGQFTQPVSTTTTTTVRPKTQKFKDSTIHRLKGKYVFNGKPNGIYVLGDKYNSLYGDELQNFYP